METQVELRDQGAVLNVERARPSVIYRGVGEVLEFNLESRLWKAQGTIPLLGSNLKIYVVQEGESPPTQRQREILDSLQRLPKSLAAEIAAHALDYYRRIDAEVNLAAYGIIIDETNIGSHVRYKSVLIPEIRECDTDYIFITADCDWEEEHGMQILIGDLHVISCGDPSALPFSSQWIDVISAPKNERP